MIRFRIRDTKRHRTVIESSDLAVIDRYWEQHKRPQDEWLYQWKDAEQPSHTILGMGWSEPPLSDLTRIRDEARWFTRAELLLDDALSEMRQPSASIDDVIVSATAALAAIRIAMGELPPSELDGFPFPGEPADESGCVCPPDLLDRGGFKGRCPVHGSGAATTPRTG